MGVTNDRKRCWLMEGCPSRTGVCYSCVPDGDDCPIWRWFKKQILLKEQEAEWVYGEDEKNGVDGWYCSKCDFFEPWFYDFDNDIDFISHYEHCPKCGRRMTSYTGKQKGR